MNIYERLCTFEGPEYLSEASNKKILLLLA